jgi:hypothetical protein
MRSLSWALRCCTVQILATDRHWRELLRFVRDRGAVAGPKLPDFSHHDAEDRAAAAAAAAAGGAAASFAEPGDAAGAASGAASGGTSVADLQRELEKLAISGAGGASAAAPGSRARDWEELFSFLPVALDVEGGEMRRMD